MGIQESFSFFANDDRTRPRLPFPESYFHDLAMKGVYVGTSSWKFRGWEGILYGKHYKSEAEFQREALREYARALPMVGVDFTFYDWPHANQMVTLANSVTENFRFCLKATDKLVTERFPNQPRYGRVAGKENPLFLDAEAFLEHFWKPLEPIRKQIGSIIFEFPFLTAEQLPRLDAFFEALPSEVPCSLELRSRELFTADFYRRLIERNVAPALSSWTRMPTLASQWKLFQPLDRLAALAGQDGRRRPIIVRATSMPGLSYEEGNREYEPFDRICNKSDSFTETAAEIIRTAIAERREAYIIVNNLVEGSSPLSIGRIAEFLQRPVQ